MLNKLRRRSTFLQNSSSVLASAGISGEINLELIAEKVPWSDSILSQLVCSKAPEGMTT